MLERPPIAIVRLALLFPIGLAAIVHASARRAEAQPAPVVRGDVIVRIVCREPVPKRRPVVIDKVLPFFGKELPNESLLVGGDGGLENIVAWLEPAPDEEVPPPDEPLPDEVTMVMDQTRFVPHVLAMSAGQTLTIPQSDDPFRYIPILYFGTNRISAVFPTGKEPFLSEKLTRPEKRPVHVSDGIHPWMTAYIIVAPTAYRTISGPSGVLKLKGVPVGRRTFCLFHESVSLAKVDKVKDGVEVVWSKRRFTFDVREGENDLGTFAATPPKE